MKIVALRCFLAALSLTFLSAGARAQSEAEGAVTVTGTLTDEGVECPAFRGDDGQLYTLASSSGIGGFMTGDRARVEGNLVEISIRQQGVTIQVLRVERAEASDKKVPSDVQKRQGTILPMEPHPQ